MIAGPEGGRFEVLYGGSLLTGVSILEHMWCLGFPFPINSR